MRRRRLPAEKPQTPRAFAVGSAVGGWGSSLIMTNPPGRCANASATDRAEAARSAFGASDPLPSGPVKAGLLNRQPTLALVTGLLYMP